MSKFLSERSRTNPPPREIYLAHFRAVKISRGKIPVHVCNLWREGEQVLVGEVELAGGRAHVHGPEVFDDFLGP